jgi:septal ring factor EnvC (AmiA/AmiB activator)
MREEDPHGQSRPEFADPSSESGWVTTDVAARAIRVSPRTIRRYIDQGRLEAQPQGEGVRREWLVSVDSLHALRAARTFEEASSRTDRVSGADIPVNSIADVLREMAARLERRAEEAAELRLRLELTERAQSTLETELAEANRRREEAERELEELRRQLEARAEPPESPESPSPTEPATDASGVAQEAAERREERKGWFRRYFGF